MLAWVWRGVLDISRQRGAISMIDLRFWRFLHENAIDQENKRWNKKTIKKSKLYISQGSKSCAENAWREPCREQLSEKWRSGFEADDKSCQGNWNADISGRIESNPRLRDNLSWYWRCEMDEIEITTFRAGLSMPLRYRMSHGPATVRLPNGTRSAFERTAVIQPSEGHEDLVVLVGSQPANLERC
jgi:hypothetical protein